MEFIENFAIVDGSNDEMSVAGGDEVRNESDVNFIDDTEEETDLQSQNLTAYVLANVTKDLQEMLQDQSMTEYLDECSTPKNVVPDCLDEMEYEYDNFDGFEKRNENSQTILKYSSHAQKNLFTTQYYSAFFIEVLKKKETFEFSKDEETLVRVLRQNLFEMLSGERANLFLDFNLSTVQRHCQVVNNILVEKNLFLSVYELKKNFCYLIKKRIQKNVVRKDLSACVEEHFSRFDIVKKLF